MVTNKIDRVIDRYERETYPEEFKNLAEVYDRLEIDLEKLKKQGKILN